MCNRSATCSAGAIHCMDQSSSASNAGDRSDSRPANVAIGNDRAIPAPGVYATIAHLESGPTPSVTNIGVRPTFDDGGGLSIECHIIDFDEDIYGRDLRVEFVERLRGERKFDGIDTLVAQIGKDRDAARELLVGMGIGTST